MYKRFASQSKVVSYKASTGPGAGPIKNFNFETLYNFKSTATSLLGYKHKRAGALKMKKFYENKNNHPMFGKNHSEEALALISKPGKLNSTSRERRYDQTKMIMAKKKK